MTTEPMFTTAALSPRASIASRPSPRFSNTLASEWVKLSSLRSTYIMLALGLFLSLATTAVASVAMGSTRDEWPGDFNSTIFSMVGNIFTLIIYSVFGVVVMTREYSSGIIRLTFTATPARGQVFVAKLLLVSVVTFVFGMIATVGMFLVGRVVLGAYGMPVTGIGDADAWRMVIGLGAVMPFFPVAGLALGVVLRSTSAAITTVLGLLWLPLIFGEFFPTWWQENVISMTPSAALDSFTIAHVVESSTYLEPALGSLVAAAWLLIFLGSAWGTLVRRDV